MFVGFFSRFPRDNMTYSIDRQFLIGPALLITPVLEQGAVAVNGYFPANHWYDYYTGRLVVESWSGPLTLTLNSIIDHIPVHIRGGHILPTQKPALNTAASRLNPFGLIVAPDGYGHARGDLFYDDGETDVSLGRIYYATFSLSESMLKMYVEMSNYSEMHGKVLNTVRIFTPGRAAGQKLTFVINKSTYLLGEKIEYKENEIVLNDLNLPMTEHFQIEWSEIYFPDNSFGPIIDCALDNPDISESACVAKGCVYFSINRPVPKCFVSQNVGKYCWSLV